MMSIYCSKHVEGYNKLIVKQSKYVPIWSLSKSIICCFNRKVQSLPTLCANSFLMILTKKRKGTTSYIIVKFTLEQAMNSQMNRRIALLFI